MFTKAQASSKTTSAVFLDSSIPLLDTERAYLAGFIDADGCIAIGRHMGKGSPVPKHTLYVVVVQVKRAVLDYWCWRTGLGTVYVASKQKGNRNESFQWRLGSRAAEKLIQAVLPYLIVKQGQARVALQFRATFSRRGGSGRRGGGCSRTLPRVIAQRERFRRAVAALNGRKLLDEGIEVVIEEPSMQLGFDLLQR